MIFVLIADIVIFVALTFLSWYFGKWWIILFFPLLMITCKSKGADDEDV